MPPLRAAATDVRSPLSGVAIAAALHREAFDAASAGRPVDAVRLLRRALTVLPAEPGDADATSVRVRILITLSYGEAETGSIADGLAHLDAATLLVEALPEGDLRIGLAPVIKCQQALLLHRAGRTAEALTLFDAAITGLETGHELGAVTTDRLAGNLINRGLTRIAFGVLDGAEQDMHRTIDLAEAADLPLMKAKALHNLGDIAQLTGDVPTALRHYDDTVREFRALAPDLVYRVRIDQARTLLAAGLGEEAAQHLDEALAVLRERRVGQDLAEAELSRAAAALLHEDPGLARDLAGRARRRFLRRGSTSWAELAALTRMRAELDVPASRIATPRRAVDLAGRLAAVGLADESAVATMLAARMSVRRGALDSARSLLADLPHPGPTTPIDHRMLLRLCQAEVAVAAGRDAEALAQARAGLEELGVVRDRMGGLDLLCGTAVHGRELGELAVGLVLDRGGDPAAAFDWLERTRAQVYRYEPLPAMEDTSLARRVNELRSLSRSIQQARLEGRPIEETAARFSRLQREITRLGWHTSAWGRPRPVARLADVVGALGSRALVSFVSHGDVLRAVVVVDGRASLVRLGAWADVSELARQLHADLDALAPDLMPAPLVAAVTASATRRARLLDDALLGPPASLVGTRELVVVPTGDLYAVPWGALPSLHGRPVVVAPSATAWLTASESAARSSASRVALVSGPGLSEARGEVHGLLSTYPDAVEPSSVADVLAALDGARLAHIAAHGEHVADNALFSRLELSDGFLFAHETVRLKRVPEQVVLAACSLALSRIRPGDEALGFAGALLAGGSHTVVAAVNKVGDRAAARTMDVFHELLSSGAPAAAALAEATASDPLRRPFVCFGSGS
ncbi:CHAT domain-containing protein [Saccharothrix violaceirubra]|uniref:Tetratricopeptide (TPR) repeat protein n=1 Tax=Saccharothrix violaceirubra TaxID=413306 RepID=A0A7W7T8Z9_9PSEU|nr:CHAT domain-containing protein [Saccharothrix violaceirubra]MBB4968783.1 tetratricopeptide (TPR) repeat protein [Saccharothrix violaceirubra]